MSSHPVGGVPSWVRELLHRLTLQTPRVENSWYGPLNKLFFVIFSGRNWMVQPPTPFRYLIPVMTDSDEPYDGAIAATARIPDFAIFTCTPSLINYDTLHIAVEVKRLVDDVDEAIFQVGEYLDTHAKIAPNAFGITIAGSDATIVRLDAAEGLGGQVEQQFHIDDPQLIQYLVQYAAQFE